ncbi:MAG TPA: CYTH domain-containing protein [Dokdonella sp.]|uniref:CYTH domain-containing protein n=1 Tax=Dokdonella sp. TaxID=2291710 RepID=UPI002CC43EFB|nr:CYTH domain-containing protein [Dokdonella sp.]HUD43256.1 CYTH domain-containing protein [Dokdonella sp.]
MAIEIERKFLVVGDAWRAAAERSTRMVQAYLAGPMPGVPAAPRCSVRVRVAGERAWLNLKSLELGIARQEFEYPIPLDDANALLALAGRRIEKTRHDVRIDAHVFEVDEFAGDNAGLIVAELELGAVDEPFPRPAWLGREVSALPRYYNVHLIDYPYARWTPHERAGEASP